ncbi:MAG: hypothetical protein ACK5JF_11690, partial [Oscillospiraceae bacterium]
HDGYYILHMYNKIKCMDWENSIWRKNRFNKEKASIDELVLDNAKLDEVPLEERLVFKVWEDSSYFLFHQSIVEKMLEIVPTGLTVSSMHHQMSELPFFKEYMSKKEKKDSSSTKQFAEHLMTFATYGPLLDMVLELGSGAEEIAESMGITLEPKEDKEELQKVLREAKDNKWLDKLCLAVLDESQSQSAVLVCCIEMLKSNIHADVARAKLEEMAEESSDGGYEAKDLLEKWDNGNKDIEF